jgi:hypothetical protein
MKSSVWKCSVFFTLFFTFFPRFDLHFGSLLAPSGSLLEPFSHQKILLVLPEALWGPRGALLAVLGSFLEALLDDLGGWWLDLGAILEGFWHDLQRTAYSVQRTASSVQRTAYSVERRA